MSGAMHDICHAWHNVGISRSGYQRAFGHAGHHAVIAATFKEHELGRSLEIGSMSWQWCIEPFGIEPRSLTCINISEVELQKGVQDQTLTSD